MLSQRNLVFLILSLLAIKAQAIGDNNCSFNGLIYNEGSQWQHDCQKCMCANSVPICHKIQCKYEPCAKGKIFVLNEDDCCPSCQTKKKTCHYKEYLIEHNTEFSPKNCEICKCKNSIMECMNSCQTLEAASFNSNPFIESTSLLQRQQRLKQHNRKHRMRANQHRFAKPKKNTALSSESKRVLCVHDGKVHHFNSTWSPLRCTQCKCNFGGEADCYVKDCPALENCEHVSFLKKNESIFSCKIQNRTLNCRILLKT